MATDGAAAEPLTRREGDPPLVAPRGYARAVAAVFFTFLLFSDWVVLGGPFLGLRRALVAVVALAALPFAFRRPRSLLRALARPPLAFFAAFLIVGLALAPAALAPADAALHTAAFVGMLIFAAAAAETVSLSTVLAFVRVTLAVKLVGSLLVGIVGGGLAASSLAGPPGGTLAYRHSFGGLFGNPNPLCDAAALYLLLVACDLAEPRTWREARSRASRIAFHALTVPVAAYLLWQSVSRSAWLGLLIVGIALVLLAEWRAMRDVRPLARRSALAASAAAAVLGLASLLVWLDVGRGVIHPGGSFAERVRHAVASGAILDAAERPQFWAFALERIRERPWTGYGMASTPLLYAERFQGRPEHSHNLELEGALYAGISGALAVLLFAAGTARSAAVAFLRRRPDSLATAAALFLLLVLSQVEPVILGSPYPWLLVVLVLAAHLDRAESRSRPAV